MYAIGQKLCKLFQEESLDPGNILRKFLLVCQKCLTMPIYMVWTILCYGKDSFFHVASPFTHGTRKGKIEELERKEVLEVVWKSRHRNKMDFHEARNGDYLLVPFECDLCIFRKLKDTYPISNTCQDDLLLVCTRRMNLEAFWGQTRLTVQHDKRLVQSTIKFSELIGLEGLFEYDGSYPCRDHYRYEIASNKFSLS